MNIIRKIRMSPNNENLGKANPKNQKEKEIERIDAQIDQLLLVLEDQIAAQKDATNAASDCVEKAKIGEQSISVCEFLITNAKDMREMTDEINEYIEALELQRSILKAGL